jgi:hypothetical protein
MQVQTIVYRVYCLTRFGELVANAVAETQDVVENDKLNAIDGIVATEMITALMDDTIFK